MIEIYEIPYTTATEIIMDKVAELIKRPAKSERLPTCAMRRT